MAGNRLSWDELYVLIATIYSSRGSCDRLRTACILVKNNRIVGAGYNGAVGGLDNCDEVGHLIIENHCLRTIHGEGNAVNNAVADLDGATAYVIATPCLDCVKNLLQNGIKRIVYVGSYENAKGKKYITGMCQDKGVALEQWSSDPGEVLKLLGKVLRRLRGAGGIFFSSIERSFWEKIGEGYNKDMKSNLIVIEGSDSSGKATQTKLLVDRLKSDGRAVMTTSFPRYGEPVVEKIRTYLKENPAKDPYEASKLYAEDRMDAAPQIRAALERGETVVLDRFTDSNAAHQGGKIADLELRQQYVEWLYWYEYQTLGIPKPDLVVILRVPVEVSLSLIQKRGGARDGHEANAEHLRNAEATYELLAQWYPEDHKLVECVENGKLLPKEAIAEKVYTLIKPLLQ